MLFSNSNTIGFANNSTAIVNNNHDMFPQQADQISPGSISKSETHIYVIAVFTAMTDLLRTSYSS